MSKYQIFPLSTWLEALVSRKLTDIQHPQRHGYIELTVLASTEQSTEVSLNPFDWLQRTDNKAWMARLINVINSKWAKFNDTHPGHKSIEESIAAGCVLSLTVDRDMMDDWLITLKIADKTSQPVHVANDDLAPEGLIPSEPWGDLAKIFSDDTVIAFSEMRPIVKTRKTKTALPAPENKSAQKFKFDDRWQSYCRERALAMDARLKTAANQTLFIPHPATPAATERLTAFFDEISRCDTLSFMEKRLAITGILGWVSVKQTSSEFLQLRTLLEQQNILVKDFRCQVVGMSHARKNGLQLVLTEIVRNHAPQENILLGLIGSQQLNYFNKTIFGQTVLEAILHVNLDDAVTLQLMSIFLGVYCYKNEGADIIPSLQSYAHILTNTCKAAQKEMAAYRLQTEAQNPSAYEAADAQFWHFLLNMEMERVLEQTTAQEPNITININACEKIRVNQEDAFKLKLQLIMSDSKSQAVEITVTKKMCDQIEWVFQQQKNCKKVQKRI